MIDAIRGGVIQLALRPAHTCVGDVEIAVRPNGQIVQEPGTSGGEIDCDERSAAPRIEPSEHIDIEHPERISLNPRSHRGVERHPVPTALNEVKTIDDAISAD